MDSDAPGGTQSAAIGDPVTENQEQKAAYVPPATFVACPLSYRFSCYVSLDGVSLNTKANARTARTVLELPQASKFGFVVDCTWYKLQYSMIRINIVAPGALDTEDEVIGTILVKGVSIKSCSHESFVGRQAVSELLSVFCEGIRDNTPLPGKMVKFTAECTKVHVLIHDNKYDYLRHIHPTLADGLDHIREAFDKSANKQIGIIFYAADSRIGYLKDLCAYLKVLSDRDKDKRHPEHPFAGILNTPPDLPQHINRVLPALDCWDTEEEWLAYNVMGKTRDHSIEVDNARKLGEIELDARAIELKHHGGRRFMLYVQTPSLDGVYEPKIGDTCYVFLKDVEREVPSVVPDDRCTWWEAERSAATLDGAPDGYSLYIVTIPADQTSKDGQNPLIDAKFPILKWDDLPPTDRSFCADRVMEHFADKAMRLTVSLFVVPSDNTLEALVTAHKHLHAPHLADPKFPVNPWSLDTYRFLMDFSGGETSNIFEKFPHMENILKKPEQVPPYLVQFWHSLDKYKQRAYRSLNNVRQNIKWIVGVAGCGKTHLIQFMIHMAMFGDKDTVHRLKILYFVPHNAAVDDFAMGLHSKNADADHKITVIRLYGLNSEVRDFIRSQLNDGQTADLFDAEEAKRACVGVDAGSLVQHQLAQLAIDVDDARASARRDKVLYLSLQEEACAYFEKHRTTKYRYLDEALEEIKHRAQSGVRDELRAQRLVRIRAMVAELYADYLEQFSGVIAATPHTGCTSEFARHVKPDMAFVDEGGRIGDPELLLIIRTYTLSLLTIVGDPAQGRPFVRSTYGPKVVNPWQEQVKRSPMERAINKGGIVDSMLFLNHRTHGGLVRLPSKAIYNNNMMPAAIGEDGWPKETEAWHQFLLELCPILQDVNRILVELHGAEVEKLGTSPYNLAHVKYISDVVLKAMKNPTLTGLKGKSKTILIMAFYTGQVHHLQQAIDSLVRRKLLSRDERRRIRVRTVDAAQGDAADLVIVDYTRNDRMGFLWDPHRNCVALTRARQAEIILMHRGIFVGLNRWAHEDMPPGYNRHLLPMIYEDVAGNFGVVSEVVGSMAKQKSSKIPEEVSAGLKAGDRCFNCWKVGHRQQACMEPLRCGNCEGLGHTSDRCRLPAVQRCRVCRGTGHRHGGCLV